MPEGDVLFRTAVTLQKWLAGREVTAATTAAAPMVGRTVERVEANGKHLLVRFDSGHVLHTHLRMSGSWHVYRTGERWQRPPSQAKVSVTCAEHVAVCFNAPVVELLAPGGERSHPSLSGLGPDVLARPLDLVEIRRRARQRPPSTALGELLLDQRVVAGIGNIWRCESLFLEGRSPWAPVSSLTDDELDALLATAAKIMGESLGPFTGRPSRWVYRRARQPCHRCRTTVLSRGQGEQSRTAYWCPTCQPGLGATPATNIALRPARMPDVTYDPHRIAEVFGRAAASYDSVIPFFAEFGTGLVEFAALRPGESVLDIGSGRGATLLPAAERVGPEGRVLGIDLSPEMVRLLHDDIGRRGLSQASAAQMDAGALDVEPASVDVVLVSFVLHLLPNPDAAARGIATALRPGGRCAAASPTGSGPEWDFIFRTFGSFAARLGRPMVVPFRPEFDVAATLAGAGLDVTRATSTQLEFPFADEQAWWDWAWTHGMRGVLEMLPPDDLEGLRSELFAGLATLRTESGIAMPQSAAYVVAEKHAG